MNQKAELVGEVTHYYDRIGVAIVKLKKPLAIGARVKFAGHKTDFEQEVSSLQYDHQSVDKVPSGKEAGLKVSERAREGDRVYLLSA